MRLRIHVGSRLQPCRRASARRGAGPGECLWGINETGLDRIPLNVSLNPAGLVIIPNKVIITLLLPERPARRVHDPIRLVASESLQRSKPDARRRPWRDQQMDVVRHNDEGVQLVSSELNLAGMNGSDNHLRDLRLPQINRSGPRVIQHSIHQNECLAAGDLFRRERPVCRQAVAQSEGNKHHVADRIPVRQPALIAVHRNDSGSGADFLSQKVCAGQKPGGRAEALTLQE